MLDSSPIRGPARVTATQQPPPPPKKLKRSASKASLPSPPPTERPRKKVNRLNLTARRGSYIGDSDVEEGDDEDEDVVLKGGDDDEDEGEFMGRKILFPISPSRRLGDGAQIEQAAEDDEFFGPTASPVAPVPRSVSPVRRSPRLQAAAAISSAPSTPVKPKLTRSLSLSVSPTRVSNRLKKQREDDRNNKGKCRAYELPILDEEEDNPFLAKTPSPKTKLLKGKARATETKAKAIIDEKMGGKRGRDEPRQITYVFKGVKTHFPNPYYNLPQSAYEKAKLPLHHPDYEPLPPQPMQLKFKPKKRNDMNGASGSGGENGEGSSKQFADSDEDEEEDEEDVAAAGEDANADDAEEPSTPTREEAASIPEPRTPDNRPKYSGFRSESGKPLLDSGPEGVRGAVMDSDEIGRMALGPVRDRGGRGVKA